MGIPRNQERAKAWCRGWLQPRPTRQWRISNANRDTITVADTPVPNLGLVRRWAAAAALHPNARSNGAAGERLTESVNHTDTRSIPNGEHPAGLVARNDQECSDHAS